LCAPLVDPVAPKTKILLEKRAKHSHLQRTATLAFLTAETRQGLTGT
jgi:hypothetical protein